MHGFQGLITRDAKPLASGAAASEQVKALVDLLLVMTTARKHSDHRDVEGMPLLERSPSVLHVVRATNLDHVVPVAIFHDIQIVRRFLKLCAWQMRLHICPLLIRDHGGAWPFPDRHSVIFRHNPFVTKRSNLFLAL